VIPVNPTLYDTLRQGMRFVVNHQFLDSHKDFSGRGGFIARLGCTLRIEKAVIGANPRTDYLVLMCDKKYCDHCMHDRDRWPVHITRADLGSGNMLGSQGSLIVRLFNRTCHKCGEASEDCWRIWSSHFVCSGCISGSGHPPFPYGKGTHTCCSNNGCGAEEDGLEPSFNVYLRAVALQTERNIKRSQSG